MKTVQRLYICIYGASHGSRDFAQPPTDLSSEIASTITNHAAAEQQLFVTERLTMNQYPRYWISARSDNHKCIFILYYIYVQ